MKHAIFAVAAVALGALGLSAAHAAQHDAASNAQAGIACLASHNAAAFTPLLQSAPYSAAEGRAARQLQPLIQRCGDGNNNVSGSVTLMRGLVAEDLYERQFSAAQAAATPPVAVAPLLRPNEARAPSEVTPLAPSYALAACLTAAHPDLVRAYLAAPASGDAETTAFRALTPGLAACIPAGAPRRIGVDGPTFRGILAEDLYRWSLAQRDGASSPYAAH